MSGLPVARVLGLRSVELRSNKLADTADFYSEAWGLTEVERDTNKVWLRGTGEQHHALALVGSSEPGLEKMSFAVAERGDVDAAARHLIARGLPLLEEPGRSAGPQGGYRVVFCDLEGRRVELSAETHAVRPLAAGAVPVGVTHVVLNTVDIDRAVAFWSEVMGFRLSDWSEHQMAFLRCNSYHHAIAFNQAEWTSVNHVAYEMVSVDHFMRGVGRLRQHGIMPQWGPGRHGPGNNTFSYFADPGSLVCEYTSEVQQISEGWLPRVWQRSPEGFSDLWGTAGPPSAEVRQSMAGRQDLGAFEGSPQLEAKVQEALAGRESVR